MASCRITSPPCPQWCNPPHTPTSTVAQNPQKTNGSRIRGGHPPRSGRRPRH
ncbi:hypothetical protein HMPREF1550_00093 [Actinomyces sp. oral taxon 877 str. F0543]|nr:hypothetical protein HMPREF1550_00093 [Actinomyces sp. oral taxon 877 str. F0543]